MKRIWGDGEDDRFSDSINLFKLASNLAPAEAPRVLLASGVHETSRIRFTTMRFHNHLKRLGISHQFVSYDGDHNWYDWTPVIGRAITLASEVQSMAAGLRDDSNI